MQLPPVKADPVFFPIKGTDLTKKLGGMGSELNFWADAFTHYEELKISMRHKDDKNYAELLERVRIGQMTNEDVEVLLKRRIVLPEEGSSAEMLEKIADEYENLKKIDPNVVCLMALSEMVDTFNECLLKRENRPIVTVVANDTPSGYRSKKMLDTAMKRLEELNKHPSDTAGIEAVLKLCIGARVILRRNTCVQDGLVNGALGVVEGFEWEVPNEKLQAVYIRFDRDPETVQKIEQIKVDFKVTNYVTITRFQFPLLLAYGLTFYKSQGLSFDNIMADLGNTVFGEGMSYVGLSRCRKLSGLFLLNFDPKTVKCSKQCIIETNRLRGSDAAPLSTNFTKHRSVPDRMWYAKEAEPEKKKGRKSKASTNRSETSKNQVSANSGKGKKRKVAAEVAEAPQSKKQKKNA